MGEFNLGEGRLFETNTNAIRQVSWRGVPRFAGRRSNPPTLSLPLEGGGLGGGEIAAPFALYTMRCPEPYRFRAVQGFGLAMTCEDIYCVCFNTTPTNSVYGAVQDG